MYVCRQRCVTLRAHDQVRTRHVRTLCRFARLRTLAARCQASNRKFRQNTPRLLVILVSDDSSMGSRVARPSCKMCSTSRQSQRGLSLLGRLRSSTYGRWASLVVGETTTTANHHHHTTTSISRSPLLSARVHAICRRARCPLSCRTREAQILHKTHPKMPSSLQQPAKEKRPPSPTEHAPTRHTKKPSNSLPPRVRVGCHNSNASMASLWKSALRRRTSFTLSGEYGFLPPLLPLRLPLPLPAPPGRLGVGGGRNSSASDGRSELSRRTCDVVFLGF